MNAIGPVQSGIAGYDAGKYTRRVMFHNAQAEEAGGVAEREKIRLASRITEGNQIVAQGSSGFQVGTGSATDALRESAIARELDIMTSRFNATSRAAAMRQQGNLAKAKGYSEAIGGFISGATTLMDDAAAAFGGGGGAGAGAGTAGKA